MEVTIPKMQTVRIEMKAWDAEVLARALLWLNTFLTTAERCVGDNLDLTADYEYMARKILTDGGLE